MRGLLTIDRALHAGVDPLFGGALSLAEQALWESILLGAKRRQRTWREWLQSGISLFNPQGSPFGSSSGGAGGNVTTPQAGAGRGDDVSFGNAYPWLYPTSDFQNFDKWGSIALPAIASTATIGSGGAPSSMPWAVPKGFNGFIKTMAAELVANGGAAWTPGVLPAQLTLSILRGASPPPDYGNFAYSPGTVQSPTPIAGIPIKEGFQISISVANVSLAVTTQFVTARLQGYYYGKQLEPKGLAF